MRNRFDQQLDRLNVELITMGALCEQAIATVAKAMLDRDNSLISNAMEVERKIDQMERDIESLCLQLLLRQQPVASDLRTISAAMRMISDMERIGDQAADIAEILNFVGEDSVGSAAHIGDMARATIKMVTDSVDSFVQKNLQMAEATIAYDDVVDDLFNKVKSELTEAICQDPNQGERFLDFLMIAKYFERIGDHAVNIAEWVCYSITNVHPKSLKA